MYVKLFLAVLLIALWFQLNGVEGFAPLWTSETKKDYNGNDIGTSLTGISLNDCKKKCLGDSTCKGIVTDFSGDGPGTCWMKNNWGDATDNESRFTYKLTRR
jgi:hypothetical protein